MVGKSEVRLVVITSGSLLSKYKGILISSSQLFMQRLSLVDKLYMFM